MRKIIATFILIQLTVWSWIYFGEDEPPRQPGTKTVRANIYKKKRVPVVATAGLPTAPRSDFAGLDPGVWKVVLSLAKSEPLCAQGVRTACRQLSVNENSGKRQLAAVRARLGKECGKSSQKACFLSGEIELEAGRAGPAARWYDRAKALASPMAARCRDRQETDRAACNEALTTLSALKVRDRRLAELRQTP